ncbi:HAD-IA family hydrolase [Kineococcus gynurae]|uniref:HAD-IA family hydrolase n=1 Tax=Kineococcus gynurae TaxID=452979 RepID=A0ABV5LML8_9ACTN
MAGTAGSGKTTLGRAVARSVGAALLDLDTVTNPLLDELAPVLPGDHWLSSPVAAEIRRGRYAALRATAADVLAGGVPVVLVAPFTAELRGGVEWRELLAALAPHQPTVLHLDGPDDVLAARRAVRGASRDAFRSNVSSTARPLVPHVRVDVLLSPAQQLFRARQALGLRAPVPASELFQLEFSGFLFDLDGTLVDSTPAVLRAWARLAMEFGFPLDVVQDNHGRPARPLLAELLPPDRVDVALARVLEFENTDVDDVVPTPGAVDLLAALPPERVALVTSGRRSVVRARLAAAGMAAPAVTVTRDDVTEPKPHPEPYLAGAAALGLDAADCLAVEDAPAGIRSARAAGCRVLAVRGTVDDADLVGADLVVDSLDQLTLVAGRLTPRL